MIYADNAAATKMSKTAINAMLPFFEETYANPSSLHTAGQAAADALNRAREQIAECLCCQADEIIFTSGGSEADNQAILTAAQIGKRKNKLHILSTAFEHHAVLNTLKTLEKEGFEVELLDVGSDGFVTAEQVKMHIRPDTCLVTVMYANNEIGTIQPIARIGTVCRAAGVLFHTDAVQAAGQLHIDVKEQSIDMLSISAHKFHGPKGIGVLYARKDIEPASVIHGGAQEHGKRAGTQNVPAIAGMAAALKEACESIDKNTQYVTELRDRLIYGLSKIPHSQLNGSKADRLPGNVNFSFEGIEGESLLLQLDAHGICASSGSACTSGSLEVSRVLLAIGRTPEIAQSALRLSLSRYNTAEEVDEIVKAVTCAVGKLRSLSPLWNEKVSVKKEFIL